MAKGLSERYLLLLDKEAGVTSFSYIPKLRRLFSLKKIGHAGTLDPFATGLMTYAIGRATPALTFLEGLDKVYELTAVFGRETDTYDRDGVTVQTLDQETLDRRLASLDLLGEVEKLAAKGEQTVPLYSALKKDGKPFYAYAREGRTIALPTRAVSIEVLDKGELEFRPEGPALKLTLKVSKGTYIRSFVHELGQSTKLLAYCHSLRRRQVGALALDAAVQYDELEARIQEYPDKHCTAETLCAMLYAEGYVKTLSEIFETSPRFSLNYKEAKALLQGRKLQNPGREGTFAAYYQDVVLGFVEGKPSESNYRSLRMFYSWSDLERVEDAL